MTKYTTVIAFRLFFGILTLAAVGTQLVIQISMGFSIINFFSYFTNLSNIFAAMVLLFGAFQLVTQRQPSALDNLFRSIAVVNMALVGIVFSVLLRDTDVGHLLPWVNIVLHYIMPITVIFEWLFQLPSDQVWTAANAAMPSVSLSLSGLCHDARWRNKLVSLSFP